MLLSIIGGFPVGAQTAGDEAIAATERLFRSVEANDMAGVQISIARGGDIDAINSWGLSPVDLAVDKGHFNIVHYLLSVREIRKSSRTTTPARAPAVTSFSDTPPPAPAPAPAPISEVYSPPPGANPWSATVVKSTSPEAPPVKTGPSPFDAAQAKPAPLPIIGDVREQQIQVLAEPEPEP
ncbi:MAG: ankyrin repeat domain-containing protein, partial [Rhodospirillaceae bacterium]|nr:ankyrin repeat domain-containing protein [Rhodospirillaceae bacterium]